MSASYNWVRLPQVTRRKVAGSTRRITASAPTITPVLQDGRGGCDECGRTWTWRIQRQGSERAIRYACPRHLRLLSEILSPDPAKHRELMLTQAPFWNPVAKPFDYERNTEVTHTGANHHQDTGVKDVPTGEEEDEPAPLSEMAHPLRPIQGPRPLKRPATVPMGVRHPSQARTRRTSETGDDLGARGK